MLHLPRMLAPAQSVTVLFCCLMPFIDQLIELAPRCLSLIRINETGSLHYQLCHGTYALLERVGMRQAARQVASGKIRDKKPTESHQHSVQSAITCAC